MILVELQSGSQRLFESLNELADAIRRAELGSSARIYHRASAQWLPITAHPELRRVLTEQWDRPLPPLGRTQWTFFGVEPRERLEAEMSPPAQPSNGHGHSHSSTASESEPAARTVWRRAFGRAIEYIRSKRGS